MTHKAGEKGYNPKRGQRAAKHKAAMKGKKKAKPKPRSPGY